MQSNQGEFWDRRYRDEGHIWGENPSPTALEAAKHLEPGATILDVGFGYGRDMCYLMRQGLRVYGIEQSIAGKRQAEVFFAQANLKPERLIVGRFEDNLVHGEQVDAVLSHRLAHLLVSKESVVGFAAKVAQVVKPGGYLFLAARNLSDLDPAAMNRADDGVYEYRKRPGHLIRFWDDESFRGTFGQEFDILSLEERSEDESALQRVPCYFSVMVAKRKVGG